MALKDANLDYWESTEYKNINRKVKGTYKSDLEINNTPEQQKIIDYETSKERMDDILKEDMKILASYTEIKKTWHDEVEEYNEQVKKWDFRFLELATTIAKWSKDPSRKVGAVIVAPNRSIISLGYNGFAKGVNDTDERYTNRDQKYELVIHAEVNAILSAKIDLSDATLYSTLLPCSRCAGVIINAGIKAVVALENDLAVFDNSKVHFDLTNIQFQEAQVKTMVYKMSEILNYLHPAAINKIVVDTDKSV